MLLSSDIITGLRYAKRVSGITIENEVLDAYIWLIDKLQFTLKQNSTLWYGLKKHLSETEIFIRDEIMQKLNKIRIYVLPLPIVIAYSDIDRTGQPIIVISNGMIEIIASNIFHAHFTYQLPEELDEFFLLNKRKDMSANDFITNILFVMQSHYFRYATQLPNLRVMLDINVLNQCKDAINGALSFILLHELGHHELGHITSSSNICDELGATFIDEEPTSDKIQENQADQFAFDAIKPEAKAVGTFWQKQALSFFSSLELVSGRTLSAEHPMSLNRNFLADIKWSELSGSHIDEKHYAETLSRFKESAMYQFNEANTLLNTPNERCISLLKEISSLYDQYGINLDKLFDKPLDPWLMVRD